MLVPTDCRLAMAVHVQALTALVAYVAISQQVKVLQFHTIIISKQDIK